MSKQDNARNPLNIVMVVIILGILAAVALPRHLEQKHEARRAQIQAWASALHSGVAIAHAAAQVYGQTGDRGNVTIEDHGIALVHGYPDVGSKPKDSGILAAAKIDSSEDDLQMSIKGNTLTLAVAEGGGPRPDCHVSYGEARGPNALPTISVALGGC
jgi:type II secretory pathway pseudopilin PulG